MPKKLYIFHSVYRYPLKLRLKFDHNMHQKLQFVVKDLKQQQEKKHKNFDSYDL